jgi:hypothetical protein
LYDNVIRDNIEVKQNDWGLTRVTLKIPRRFWNSLVVDLTSRNDSGHWTNPEKLAAALLCLVAYGYDSEKPGEFHEHDDDSFPNLVNNPPYLKTHQIIAKYLAPVAAEKIPDDDQNRVSSEAPFAAGRDHFRPHQQTISINRTRSHGFIPLSANSADWLRHLYHSAEQSIVRLREAGSGTATDPHYVTIGRIVLFFWDPAPVANVGVNLSAARGGDKKSLLWVGCNSATYIKTQKLNGVKMISPVSAPVTNNCLFACLRYARKEQKLELQKVYGESFVFFNKGDDLDGADTWHPQKENNVIRGLLKISPSAPLNMRDAELMEKLARIVKVSFSFFLADDLNTPVAVYEVEGSQIHANLLLEPPTATTNVGHVKYIRSAKIVKQSCGSCGREYLVRHQCTQKRASYFRYQMNGQIPDAFNVHIPDFTVVESGYIRDYENDVIYFDF